jgi:dynein light chain LC8-type
MSDTAKADATQCRFEKPTSPTTNSNISSSDPTSTSQIPIENSEKEKKHYPSKHVASKESVGASIDLGKVEIAKNELAQNLIDDAVEAAQEALATEKHLREVACLLKKRFDEKHGPLWHVIVGRNYGCYCSHGNF